MEKKVKVIVLSGFGINCENETKYSFELAGAEVEIVHLSELFNKKKNLLSYHILALPGGFSFGDDISSGRVLANKIKHKINLIEFIEEEKLIIGICNGFQVMVKAGILPAEDGNYYTQTATLTFNDSGRFEDRWVYLKTNPKTNCVFTKGIEKIYLPVRHGEGKFMCSETTLSKLKERNQIVLQYTNKKGELSGYPDNPNGSLENIAGICDTTGRIFGLMPHPEAFNHITNHPRWTREKIEIAEGIKIFRNGVEYVEKNLL